MSRPHPPQVVLHAGELDLLGRWAADYRHTETGGDLFGFWTHTGSPVVQFVLGPGPRSQRSSTSFYQDRSFLVDSGRALQDAHALQHIGEWHSHHSLGLAEPSGGDVDTVQRAMHDVGLERFLLVIVSHCGPDGRPTRLGDPTPRAFLFEGRHPERIECDWVVLPGDSPFRGDRRIATVAHRHPPSTERCDVRPGRITSLGRRADTTALPRDSWLAGREGARLVRRILDGLGELGALRMRLATENRLQIDVTRESGTWVLLFPNEVTERRCKIDVEDPGGTRQPVMGTLEHAIDAAVAWVLESDATSRSLHQNVSESDDVGRQRDSTEKDLPS